MIYRPDGLPFEIAISSRPRHCFLMTRLGVPIPEDAIKIRQVLMKVCADRGYQVIDANSEITGRDFLLKIWQLIASTPLCVGSCHEKFPITTLMNIYYELGAARALGKETIIIKSPKAKYPSDLIRDEYIEFNQDFEKRFMDYLTHLDGQADYYEAMADQLERNPLLAIDYLKRAFLITGQKYLQKKAQALLKSSGLEDRAKNSVEMLAASF